MSGTEIEHVYWDELAGGVKRERLTERFWIPKPKGWFFEAWRMARLPNADEHKVVWFGLDWARDAFPKREPTEEDRAVHRALVAMQRSTRAHEL